MDLFERWPGSKFADHAKGNIELRRELVEIFRTRTTADWVAWSGEVNTTIAPVNTPQTLADDPQFLDRLGFMPHETHGADMQPYPVKFVLRDVLGYDESRIAELRAANTFGPDGQ